MGLRVFVIILHQQKPVSTAGADKVQKVLIVKLTFLCESYFSEYSQYMWINTDTVYPLSTFRSIKCINNTLSISSGPFCNDMMKELESNPATRIVWNSVKPMLMGQILYAPDSPAVRQIIRNVSSIDSLVDVFIQSRVVYFTSFYWTRWKKGYSTNKDKGGIKRNTKTEREWKMYKNTLRFPRLPPLDAFCYSMTSISFIFFVSEQASGEQCF